MKVKIPKYLTAKDIQNLPTKDDVKKITTEIVGEAVDAVLDGMNEISKNMATKEELKETKEELKREIAWVRDDIKGLTEEFAMTPTRKEFEELKTQVAEIASI